MPNRTQTTSEPRPRDRWLTPLPHPSWSGEAALPDLAQPFVASEFWKRIGL
jgi:hypothetical protein